MTSLPENWESDYDGNRWFYRYRPTGIIQYTFPKPGDEYPEYIDASAPPIDLPPEEKLVSQQQLKRRSTAERSGSVSSRAKDGSDEVTSATLARGEGGFWFEPDYSYAGNISPLQEEIEEELRLVAEQKAKEKEAAAAAAQTSPGLDIAQPHISPYTSAGTTPLTGHSKPATGTPEESPGKPAAAQPTRQTPVGFVAELPSEITAKCREDTHPTPVELPGHHLAARETRPAQYLDAFDIAPAELPAQSAPAGRHQHSQSVGQQTVQSVPAASRPGPAIQHETRPSHPSRDVSSSSSVSSSTVGFQPYNANQRVVSEYNANRRSLVLNQVSVADAQVGDHGDASKRHTIANQPIQPQDVPSVLRPPLPPPKRPLDAPAVGRPPDTPYLSKAVAGSRVPSVLQPARGRPHVPLDTSQRQTSPPKTYTPYSPLQDRRGSGLTAAEHILRAETRHRSVPPESQQPPPQKQPPNSSSYTSRTNVPSRTNTLPPHMPSLPFMPGEAKPAATPGSDHAAPPRPSHGPRAQSDYAVASQSTETKPASKEATRKGEVDLSAYMNYSNPITPSDPALPKPLNVFRPAVPNRVSELADTTPSVELPASSSSARKGGNETPNLPQNSSLENRATNLIHSSVYGQETGFSKQKPPEDRPSTSYSVVSNLSVVSESSISSPPSQLSFRDRVAAKSPGPTAHRPDAQRVPSGSNVAQNFVVGDPGFAVSPGSTPSSDTSKTRPPPSAVSSQRVSSSSIPTQQDFRKAETPPPNPQSQRPPSNYSQSPGSQAASPSAYRTSVPGAPSGDYDRRQSTQSQGGVHSASSQKYRPAAQKPLQSPGGPQMLAGQPRRPSSVASSIHSSSSQHQTSTASYDQQQQSLPAADRFQPPAPSPYHQGAQQFSQAPQTQQTPTGYVQPSAGWQPQIPQYAQRPSILAVQKPSDAARPPLRPYKEPVNSQHANVNVSNLEAGRRHSASVGQSTAPYSGQMYALASTHGGLQPIPRPESVPVGISHHPTQSQPTLSYQRRTTPGAQPISGGNPLGNVPQPVPSGMLVHPQVQGLRPSAAYQQPGTVPVGNAAQTPVSQQPLPPQADASGREKRRNKLQKVGGPASTQSSPVVVQTASSQAPGKSTPSAQSNNSTNQPQSRVSVAQTRPSQPVVTPAHPTSSQQSRPTSFSAPTQHTTSIQDAQKPPQSQIPVQATAPQQYPPQTAWVMQGQSYPAANTAPYPQPGQVPYQVPVYQMTYAVQMPQGGQQPKQVSQQPPSAREDRRQSHPSSQPPLVYPTHVAQQPVSSSRQSAQPSHYAAQGSQPKPLQQQQPPLQKPVQQKTLQETPQREQYQQKPLQQPQPPQQQWGAQAGGQSAWPSSSQAVRPGPAQHVSQPAAPLQASGWGGITKESSGQLSPQQSGQHRPTAGQAPSNPHATRLPDQNIKGRQTPSGNSAGPGTSPHPKHDRAGAAIPQPAEAEVQALGTPASQTVQAQPPFKVQPSKAPAAPVQRPDNDHQTQYAVAQRPPVQGPSGQNPPAKQPQNPYEQHRPVSEQVPYNQSPPRQRLEPAVAAATPEPQVPTDRRPNQPSYMAAQPTSQPLSQLHVAQNQHAAASNGGLTQLSLAQSKPSQQQPVHQQQPVQQQPVQQQPAVSKTEPPQPNEPQGSQRDAPTGWLGWAKDKVAPLQAQAQAAPPQLQPQPQVPGVNKPENKAAPNVANSSAANSPGSTATNAGAQTQSKASSTQSAKATAGGWGNSSGYDGSGWGDDDDDYY